MKTHIAAIACSILLGATTCLAQGKGGCPNRSANTPTNIGGGLTSPGELSSQYSLALEQRKLYQLQLQQAYARQQYEQQQYLRQQQALAEKEQAAKERIIELRKERRLAEIARRDAAKAKRLQQNRQKDQATTTQIAASERKTSP